jgi:hypothetical protein
MSFYKEEAFNLFISELTELIEKGEGTIENDCLCIGDIESHLGEIASFNDDFDSNGWEFDYWCTYKINDKTLNINGSGYYGGLSITID